MLALLVLLPLVQAATRQFDLTLARMNAAPDGYTRSVIGINGEFPGPSIIVDKGDRMVITVRNELPRPTSLHCHGLAQRQTNFYDGVSGVTQCPIQPQGQFTYVIDTNDQAGTTWYHAHYKTEYVDGFRAPLIIRDPEDPHRGSYDEELVVTLADWYHQESEVLTQSYLSPASQGNEPIPDSGLINGKGRYNCQNAEPGARCSQNAPWENFNFVPGRRYRLRIINTSAFTAFKFSIDGHKLTVIEADMTPVKPVVVDRLNINVAQRYSVIVEASQQVSNYWMRAVMATACFPVAAPKLDRNVLARIHYQGAPDRAPTTSAQSPTPDAMKDCIDLDPQLLRPIQIQPVLQPTTHVQVDASFQSDAQGINRGYLNNVTFVPDFTHSMLQQTAFNEVRSFATSAHVQEVPYNGVIRVVINNSDNGEHPFHLHGFDFQVLAWSQGTYDPATTPLNTNNPIRRDTTTVPASGFTVLQFRADNLGFWAFHCHIEWHVVAGLVMIFQVGSMSEIQRGLRIPSNMIGQCNAGSRGPAQQQPRFSPRGVNGDMVNYMS